MMRVWPPTNVLPGIAPVALIIARTDETAIAMTGIQAYPTGFSFTLGLRLRNVSPREKQQLWPFPESSGSRIGEPLPGKFLRLACSSPTVAKPPTSTDPPTVPKAKSRIDRC
jgi:hypothetical protein